MTGALLALLLSVPPAAPPPAAKPVSPAGVAAAGTQGPPVTVTAEEVQYAYKEGKVVFTGKPLVTLTREDATLTCRKLVAENDASGQIRRATCSGDVKLTRGTRTVTCETATYEEKGARVICTGNPVLRDGENVVRGEVLTYDLADDRATLTQARGTVVPKGEAPARPVRPATAPPPAKGSAP